MWVTRNKTAGIARPHLPARLPAELFPICYESTTSHAFPVEEAAEGCGLRLEILTHFS